MYLIFSVGFGLYNIFVFTLNILSDNNFFVLQSICQSFLNSIEHNSFILTQSNSSK